VRQPNLTPAGSSRSAARPGPVYRWGPPPSRPLLAFFPLQAAVPVNRAECERATIAVARRHNTGRAPAVDRRPPGGPRLRGSGPASPRHTTGSAYRCFLPDLAGFTDGRCTGPDLQRRLAAPALKGGASGGPRPRYSGLRVQGTATSPSSTAILHVRPTRRTGGNGQPNLGMAERVGFEPTVRSPAHTLSRRAPYVRLGTAPRSFSPLAQSGPIIPHGQRPLQRTPVRATRTVRHPALATRTARRRREGPRDGRAAPNNVAEGVGFEPTVPFGHTAFREPHLKPLGHPSAKPGSNRTRGRRPPSRSRPRLRPTDYERRALKNARNNSADSSARTPGVTARRWLSR
jgi:hypothetical protein